MSNLIGHNHHQHIKKNKMIEPKKRNSKTNHFVINNSFACLILKTTWKTIGKNKHHHDMT